MHYTHRPFWRGAAMILMMRAEVSSIYGKDDEVAVDSEGWLSPPYSNRAICRIGRVLELTSGLSIPVDIRANEHFPIVIETVRERAFKVGICLVGPMVEVHLHCRRCQFIERGSVTVLTYRYVGDDATMATTAARESAFRMHAHLANEADRLAVKHICVPTQFAFGRVIEPKIDPNAPQYQTLEAWGAYFLALSDDAEKNGR